MRFHLCHIIPDRQIHGLTGYAEVIESIRWGLEQLGHVVTVTVNDRVSERGVINIILGAQMLSVAEVQQLPAGSIVYNLEQIAAPDVTKVVLPLVAAARHCRIWDYDAGNLDTWKRLDAVFEPALVEVGWAPTLERIAVRPEQECDIEILMYGTPAENRMRVVWELGDRNYKIVYASGVYGALRDELISRSKIVVNVNRYPRFRAFEIVRVSYLLGNGKAVVSDFYPEYRIDEDLKNAIAFAPLEKVVATCEHVLADPAERQRLEAAGPAVMQRRDIRRILEGPVAVLRS